MPMRKKNEPLVPLVDRRTSGGCMYLPLDRRKIPNSSNAYGGSVGKLRVDIDGKVKPAKKIPKASYDQHEYDDYPASDYERKYQT